MARLQKFPPVPLATVLNPRFLVPLDRLRPKSQLLDWPAYWDRRAAQADERLARARRKQCSAVTTHEAIRKLPGGGADPPSARMRRMMNGSGFRWCVKQGVSPHAILAPLLLALDPYALRAQHKVQTPVPRRGRPRDPVVPHVVALWAVAIAWATGLPLDLHHLAGLCVTAGILNAGSETRMWTELGRMLNHPGMLRTLDQAGDAYVRAQSTRIEALIRWKSIKADLKYRRSKYKQHRSKYKQHHDAQKRRN